MRFLVDESAGPYVAQWLKWKGYDARCVFEKARGATDEEMLTLAYDTGCVLVVGDPYFYAFTFSDEPPHWGVILLHFQNTSVTTRVSGLEQFLTKCGDQINGQKIIITGYPEEDIPWSGTIIHRPDSPKDDE